MLLAKPPGGVWITDGALVPRGRAPMCPEWGTQRGLLMELCHSQHPGAAQPYNVQLGGRVAHPHGPGTVWLLATAPRPADWGDG